MPALHGSTGFCLDFNQCTNEYGNHGDGSLKAAMLPPAFSVLLPHLPRTGSPNVGDVVLWAAIERALNVRGQEQ